MKRCSSACQHVERALEHQIAHAVGLKQLRRREHAVAVNVISHTHDRIALALPIELIQVTADLAYKA